MQHLREHEIRDWVEATLLSPARTRPIVAITSHPAQSRGWLDPVAVERALQGLADVVFLETGDATWALSEAMPPRLDVYGGAVRTWWPGLTRDSNPYDHRLYFVHSPAEAERVQDRIVAAVSEFAGVATTARREQDTPQPAEADRQLVLRRAAPPEAPETVTVSTVSASRVEVDGSSRRGPLLETDLPLPLIAEAVTEGQQLTARPLRPLGDGTWAFSTAGLLPSPWQRFLAEVAVGDVVIGRVQNVHERSRLVFVDVLPGVVGVCHIKELDYGFVADMRQFAREGQRLAFKVLEIDADNLRLQLSRKRAHGQVPRQLPSLVEGGQPFEWRDGMPLFENLSRTQRRPGGGEDSRIRTVSRARFDAAAAPEDQPSEELQALREELEAANDERKRLVSQIRQLREQLQAEKRERRAAEDRCAAAERRGAAEHPLSSERAFLLGVRMCYAQMLDEDDRQQWPLQRMRVGRGFLDSVRATEGIETDKVVEVCVQVAANIAHSIAGRDVHQLRAGSRGADSRIRKRDGAQAWRCALQVNSPSARRLHWWNVPGKDGATIEFACIGVHDSFDIPEA